ncbi:hypothetical protein Pmani_019020 [Petrolisthes manimaculis]|uniref:Uncharacterized protein n=1 Tax=Petrolisthes manimaculis TaxID=1843537 RepID=A0AAE1PIJ9_9EUCA|nr:hypothetical protein Pmani_019020 [Petrolisthes manimaculis]
MATDKGLCMSLRPSWREEGLHTVLTGSWSGPLQARCYQLTKATILTVYLTDTTLSKDGGHGIKSASGASWTSPRAELMAAPKHTTLIGVVKPASEKRRPGRKVIEVAATPDLRRPCGLTRSLAPHYSPSPSPPPPLPPPHLLPSLPPSSHFVFTPKFLLPPGYDKGEISGGDW